MLDSGLGGLSVLARLRAMRPDLDVCYLGDRAWAPYGAHDVEDVRVRVSAATGHLIGRGASLVALACNTASAAALMTLRADHPDIPFVGMEPAIKPAAAATSTGVIGVLATSTTFQGTLFASLLSRLPADVDVLTRVCEGWVEMVERGTIRGPDALAQVRRHVEPLVAGGADTLVLGCTHYPHLGPLIAEVAGPGVTIIDPSDAVARQISRLSGPSRSREGTLRMAVTGPAEGVADLVRSLSGLAVSVESVTLPRTP